MKQKPPSFQFYPKQWLGDNKVMLMDWDAKGMHIHLISISWQQTPPGTLPNDEFILRRWLKNPSMGVWKRVWPQLKTAWKTSPKDPSLLFSRALRREWGKCRAFSNLQKKKALLSWVARRENGDATGNAMAKHRHVSGNARAGNALQSSSSSSSSEVKKGEGNPPTPFSLWLLKVNGLAGEARVQQKDALIAELIEFHLPFDYQDELIERLFKPGGTNAPNGNEGVSEYVSLARKAREAEGLRKIPPAGEILAGVRNLPNVESETKPGG